MKRRPMRIFTIPPGMPFLPALARRLQELAGDDPLALSRMTVLLPTRRAVRSLREAFLALSPDRPLILPRLSPLGDVDDDELLFADEMPESADLPPAIPDLRRRFILARAILRMPGHASRPDLAVALAGELARFLDQVQTERLDFSNLKKLAPDEYARHWQQTLDFLSILTSAWPRVLKQEGAIDPAERRNRALAMLARQWTRRPPREPVIAAGSTGTIPATAELLAAVARLPQGAVVLPGLDRELDDSSWAQLDETHPQFGIAQLLNRLGVARDDVADWPGGAPSETARARLLSEAMRPAATTDAWHGAVAIDAAASRGLQRVDCTSPQAEASTIALLMRQALETPGRTAALVTPDRTLARRVAVELARFGIVIDDSAGSRLSETPPLVFLRLVAELNASAAAPVAFLACLKHPLAAGGRAPGAFRALVRRIETAVLRGPRPAPGFEGLDTALAALPAEHHRGELRDLVAELATHAAPFARLLASNGPPGAVLRAHVDFAEWLAQSNDSPGASRLWAHDAGEAAAEFVAEFAAATGDFPSVPGAVYPAFFLAALGGRVVRPRFGRHPRLAILGLLEARLIKADLMILGGLNEGTWPPEPVLDPWLSRPMRKAFGLPGPERRIGLTAHDFVQAACGAEVVITRARRVEGAPTVPARWLQRLDAVLDAGRQGGALRATQPVAQWLAALDRAPRQAPTPPPAPRPPVACRPTRLSVTQIETLRRDPYAIYARHILRLEALDPIDADPGAAERGIAIHEALAAFVRAYRDELPDNAEAELLRIGEQVFGATLARPTVWAFWWPRYARIARWFVAMERTRRAAGAKPLVCEGEGTLALSLPGGGKFTLTARADRIDELADGTLAIIDYKTGVLPKPSEVALGFAPQLPLEAAIARKGGFRDVPAVRASQLRYWRLSGGRDAGEEVAVDGKRLAKDAPPLDPVVLADDAEAGLARLAARYRDPATPYPARPLFEYAPRYSDYGHLARLKEWATLEDEA
ncbi:MAG TPA: double-strand break repair protein AddB [Alphaproteobacteria bacterium]|nr:double-strand break repair protein AddB [Alphaproteobacteria bacterium]